MTETEQDAIIKIAREAGAASARIVASEVIEAIRPRRHRHRGIHQSTKRRPLLRLQRAVL